MSHSSGHWKYEVFGDGSIRIHSRTHLVLAMLESRPGAVDDAKLMAMSPQLLEACEAALMNFIVPGFIDTKALAEFLNEIIKEIRGTLPPSPHNVRRITDAIKNRGK